MCSPNLFSIICLALALSVGTTVWAESRHEHLQGLFDYSSLQATYEDLIQQSDSHGYPRNRIPLPFSNLTLPAAQKVTNLIAIFGDEVVGKLVDSWSIKRNNTEAINKHLSGLSLGQIGDALSAVNEFSDSSITLRSLFEFTTSNRHDSGSYRAMEAIRLDVLEHMNQVLDRARFGWFIQEIVARTSHPIPIHDRTIVDVSVPFNPRNSNAQFFNVDTAQALSRAVAGRVSLFLSIPRSALANGDDSEILLLLKVFSSVHSQLRGETPLGIDISGSIREVGESSSVDLRRRAEEKLAEAGQLRVRANNLRSRIRSAPDAGQSTNSPLEEELANLRSEIQNLSDETSRLKAQAHRIERSQSSYRERMQQILRFAKEKKIPVRIHAFERTNTGPFYLAMREAIESLSASGHLPTIHIGHIAAMNPADIDWFNRLCTRYPDLRSRFVFEANVMSNTMLHGTSIEGIIQNITRL